MRTRRSIQINVCVSPAEMRRAKSRAKRETEGNVSALVRKMLFAEQAQGGASEMQSMVLEAVHPVEGVPDGVLIDAGQRFQEELALIESGAINSVEQLVERWHTQEQLDAALREEVHCE